MMTIFEMSLHCVPYILCWIQADWKFYIQTCCQITWVSFTNTVAIIFFLSGRPHFANHPPPPVRMCPLLPDPPPALLMCRRLLWMAPISHCHSGSSTSSWFFVQPFSSLGFGTSGSLIWDSFQMATCKGIIHSKFIMVMYKLSVILYSSYCSLKSNLISLMNEKYIKINTNKLLYISISF